MPRRCHPRLEPGDEAGSDGFDIADLPSTTGEGLRGATLPKADPATREEKRFNRLDRDRDGRITRAEMLGPRVNPFRKLDADRNNLLSFEEWSVRTNERFRGADANRDGSLNRAEFVSTRPKQQARPECRCSPIAARPGRKPAKPAVEIDEDSEGEGGEPTG